MQVVKKSQAVILTEHALSRCDYKHVWNHVRSWIFGVGLFIFLCLFKILDS